MTGPCHRTQQMISGRLSSPFLSFINTLLLDVRSFIIKFLNKGIKLQLCIVNSINYTELQFYWISLPKIHSFLQYMLICTYKMFDYTEIWQHPQSEKLQSWAKIQLFLTRGSLRDSWQISLLAKCSHPLRKKIKPLLTNLLELYKTPVSYLRVCHLIH